MNLLGGSEGDVVTYPHGEDIEGGELGEVTDGGAAIYIIYIFLNIFSKQLYYDIRYT